MMGTPQAIIGGVVGQEPVQQEGMAQDWFDESSNEGNSYYGNDGGQKGMNSELRQPRQPLICFGCGKPGHLMRTCRNTMKEATLNQFQGQEEQSQNLLAYQSFPQVRQSNLDLHPEYQAMWDSANMGEGVGVQMAEPSRSVMGAHGDQDYFEKREPPQTRQKCEIIRQAEGNQEIAALPANP